MSTDRPHRRPSNRRYRLPAFVLAAVLLMSVGVATIWGIRSFASSSRWVDHSYQVMTTLESALASTRSAESSARGYRLTSRASLQAEYLAAVPAAQAEAGQLIRLTRDNPDQLRDTRLLERRILERLNEIQGLVELQNREGAEKAREASLTGQGSEQMQRIVSLAQTVREREAGLLQARLQRTEHRANLLISLVVAGIVLPLILLGLLLIGLMRENRRSRALERDARRALDELQTTLIQRDRLSEQRRALSGYASMLQSCQSLQEAMDMTAHVIADLIPQVGGRCYVLRASQNLAETAARFGAEAVTSNDVLHPDDCWALRRGQRHLVEARHTAMRCNHLGALDAEHDDWTLCVPLMAQSTSLGLLYLCGDGEHPLDPSDQGLIQAVAEQLSLAIVNLQLRESLRVQSLRDAMTGLYNRRYLEENLQRELLRCQRRGLPLSVLMLDIDHFKRFNDQNGHSAGDALLAKVGQTLEAMTRNEDIACRYGGEEFTVVMPEADAETALRRAEEIREAIASTTILHLRKTFGPATTSIGVATSHGDRETPQQLLEIADVALYRAKAEGRDRVVAGG
ncbi:sensor domain-containing diguanylate cyclase [Lysobacter sp. cf310]|uniref:sensor domain-containing diguanylate cyclase n=1 Tax=Lysobacter sp. cf310 TaxID=1761790 RepID=UPI0008F0BE03|nr:diguanylate cyclase [Lysobacter sp. cf310]SFK28836.1 diguanylate cyclase (GGDEF) domain-containing protein [Lysobacter sp. cf310]